MSSAGFVVAAAVMLLLGYLVPALVRRRQIVADARVPDRFSPSLRVVERRDRSRGGRPTSTTALLPSSTPRAVLAQPEEPTVNRPVGMAERRTASEARKVAAVRAAIAARHAEQAAAARRRLVLTLALSVVTVVAWVAVAVASFQFWLALFPTAVLVGVLYLGVRAARAEREEWAGVPVSLREPRRPADGGPSFSASQLRAHLTDSAQAAPVLSDVDAGGLRWDTAETPLEVTPVVAPAPVEQAAEGTWTPVPVPVPTYTLKAAAPRRESAAFEEPVLAPEQSEEPGIDLDAVLARRRAVS